MAHVYDQCPSTRQPYSSCTCSECNRTREAVAVAMAYLKGEPMAELTGDRKSA